MGTGYRVLPRYFSLLESFGEVKGERYGLIGFLYCYFFFWRVLLGGLCCFILWGFLCWRFFMSDIVICWIFLVGFFFFYWIFFFAERKRERGREV